MCVLEVCAGRLQGRGFEGFLSTDRKVVGARFEAFECGTEVGDGESGETFHRGGDDAGVLDEFRVVAFFLCEEGLADAEVMKICS